MIAVLIGLGWAVAFVAFLAFAVILCKAAAKGDDVARRALGPASSDEPDSADDDFALSVASAMYDYSIYGRWHP
jgi:hypothetical protein